MYVATWSHDPKWYDDTKYAQDVEDKNDCFCQWQADREKYIEQSTAYDNANRQ